MSYNSEDYAVMDFDDVVAFVAATAELLDSIQLDIKNGQKYSSQTVLLSSRAIAAARKMESLLEHVESNNGIPN